MPASYNCWRCSRTSLTRAGEILWYQTFEWLIIEKVSLVTNSICETNICIRMRKKELFQLWSVSFTWLVSLPIMSVKSNKNSATPEISDRDTLEIVFLATSFWVQGATDRYVKEWFICYSNRNWFNRWFMKSKCRNNFNSSRQLWMYNLVDD